MFKSTQYSYTLLLFILNTKLFKPLNIRINMESEIKRIDERLVKLSRDIELIKSLLMLKADEEGELSDWAKNEIEKARNTPESECISFDEVKDKLRNKK